MTEYHEGDIVDFKVGDLKGIGTVRGVAVQEQAVIGPMYIIQTQRRLKGAEFSHIAVPQNMLMLRERCGERSRCHDCGALEGQIHQLGCDMERCPFCGHQLITCGCIYEKLGYEGYDQTMLPDGKGSWEPKVEFFGLPEEVYENGVSEEEHEEWEKILEKKGRVPYIVYPNMCAKCGQLWPKMFNVPDEEWDKYVQINTRHEMLCRPCFDMVKRWVDAENMRYEFVSASMVDASMVKSMWQANFLQIFPVKYDELPAIDVTDKECFEKYWQGEPKSLTYEQFLEMTGPRKP